jgi:hypothetical protein
LPVTTATARAEQMLNVFNAITNAKGSNDFLFADQAALVASNPLDLAWMTWKGVTTRTDDCTTPITGHHRQ